MKTAMDNCGKVHAGVGNTQFCCKLSVVRKNPTPAKKKPVSHRQDFCCVLFSELQATSVGSHLCFALLFKK